MVEHRERLLPRIVNAPLDWLHLRWNEALYGFPEGKESRERMETLLNENNVGIKGVHELLGLMSKTSSTRLVLRMSTKVRDSVHEIYPHGRSWN